MFLWHVHGLVDIVIFAEVARYRIYKDLRSISILLGSSSTRDGGGREM